MPIDPIKKEIDLVNFFIKLFKNFTKKSIKLQHFTIYIFLFKLFPFNIKCLQTAKKGTHY